MSGPSQELSLDEKKEPELPRFPARPLPLLVDIDASVIEMETHRWNR